MVTNLPRSYNPDVDYTACFSAINAVRLQIRRKGPAFRLLLRQAMLEYAIGNYRSALEAIRDCTNASPRDPEGWYMHGLIWLAIARLNANAIEPASPADPLNKPIDYCLLQAKECLERGRELAPYDTQMFTLSDRIHKILEEERIGDIKQSLITTGWDV